MQVRVQSGASSPVPNRPASLMQLRRAEVSPSERRFNLTNIPHPRRPHVVRLTVDTEEIQRQTVDRIGRLCNEVDRLFELLTDERLRYADLLAAVRATLGAASEGEADPLAYLRDELPNVGEEPR